MVHSKEDPNYRQCSISVMDNIADPDITFDEKGICNYSKVFEHELPKNVPENPGTELERMIVEIKKSGKNKPYDCLTGISGGVDSSYLIYIAKKWGLRPLIVHFDNGWNSEIAVGNINRIIAKTGFDLYTLVVDWEEFKDLQLSYIKSGVIDLEVPTDHAIYATWYTLAKKFGIRFVLNGNNFLTESIMPSSWIFNKGDSINLRNIHKAFGTRKLKSYPLFKPFDQLWYEIFYKVKVVKPLNYLDFNKSNAKELLKKEFGWVDYGGKHFESFYTKFYQAFILPEKFNIDKRKAHLSNLILSGQISKEAALVELNEPIYNEKELFRDKEYFLKKLGLDESFFDRYLKSPQIPHQQYGVQPFLKDIYPVLKLARPFYQILKK
jgi:N-acetyl sugar amidotransferase